MTNLFLSALRIYGREVSFFRHGEETPYHTARALAGGIGSRVTPDGFSERGEVSGSRIVLYMMPDAPFPEPTDGFVTLNKSCYLVERVDPPDHFGLTRAVARFSGEKFEAGEEERA